MVIPWASDLLFKHHFEIRPEIFAMPWMTVAVWLGFLAIKHPDRWATVSNGALLSLLTAVALFLSPRVIFMAVGLGVALAVGLGRRIGPIGLGSLAGLVALVALYGGLIGWENSWTWVYQYSKLIVGTDRLTYLTGLQGNPAHPIVVFAPLAGLVAVIWGRDRTTRCLAWMVLAMYSNVLIEGRATSASWRGHIVVGAVLLASVGYEWFSRPSRALRVAVVLMGLTIIGLPLSRFLRDSTRVLTCGRCQLGGQIAAYHRVCAATHGEPVMFEQKFHPIAVDDGAYLWTQRGRDTREFMAMLGMPARKLDILQDVRERPPVILEPRELPYDGPNSADRAWIDHFVAENYRETKHGFIVRKDYFDKLAPLLDEFGVRMHLSIIRKE